MSYSTLVSTAELAVNLSNPDWAVFDCRFTLTDTKAGLRAYQQGHVPGAAYVHLENDLSSPVTNESGRHPLPDPAVLAAKLGEWGVHNETQVVVYDDVFGAMAVRMWWLLRWLGHDKVALLDGVYPTWLKEKRPVTTDVIQASATKFDYQLADDLLVNAEEISKSLAAKCIVLIDARSERRFTGEAEPLDSKAGHIPGAISRPYDDNLSFAGDLLPKKELEREYLQHMTGMEARDIVHMCGSGVTACHNILAMEHAGLTGSRLYAGSWSEWIRDETRAIETGDG